VDDLESAPLGAMVRKLLIRSRLNAEETHALLSLPHRPRSLAANVSVVRDGQTVDSCTVLLSGVAYRNKIAGNGARQILGLPLPGDIIDLQSTLLAEADHYIHTLTRAEVAHIPHAAILDLLQKFPAIARASWRDAMVDAAIARQWVLNLGRKDARQRLAHLLCEWAVRHETAGLGAGPSYAWPLTQEQIGDAIGLTSVHVNRTLQGLRGDGLVRTDKGSIVLPNMAALRHAADFHEAYLHLSGYPLPQAMLTAVPSDRSPASNLASEVQLPNYGF
jgi:CRP-like cAMP-binding protein